MLNAQALHDILTQPRFAFINHNDRNELVAVLLHAASIEPVSVEAGEAQDALSALTAAVLDLCDAASLPLAEGADLGEVLDMLKEYIIDSSFAKDAADDKKGDECKHVDTKPMGAMLRRCVDCGTIIPPAPTPFDQGGVILTPVAAPTPVPATPGPSDPAPTP